MTEHIVATFNTQQAADAAVHELQNAGFPTSGIRRYSAEGGAGTSRAAETTAATTSSTGGDSGLGFWAKKAPRRLVRPIRQMRIGTRAVLAPATRS